MRKKKTERTPAKKSQNKSPKRSQKSAPPSAQRNGTTARKPRRRRGVRLKTLLSIFTAVLPLVARIWAWWHRRVE
jgi:hypothetical protein